MEEIRHKLAIKATPEKVYQAITTQEGLTSWWAKQTTAKRELGFVNIFTFGTLRNEMKVTDPAPNKRVEWACITSIDD